MAERGQDELALQLQPSVSPKAIFPLVAVIRYTAATTAQSSEKNAEPRCGSAKTAVYFSATMAQNRTASFFFTHTMVLSVRSDPTRSMV